MAPWVRRGYELDSLLWGRPIRPFHFAVMLATGAIAYSLVNSHTKAVAGFCSCDPWGHILAVPAWLATISLFLGWFIKESWVKEYRINPEWFAEWGLLLAMGTWLTRAVYVLISESSGLLNNPVVSTLLSLAWAIGAGGAYLLERYDHVRGGESE